MNMKRIFRKLHHADDAALRQMGQYSAMDQTEQAALFAKSRQKYLAPQEDAPVSAETETHPVIEQTHFRWRAAACAAACMAVCAAAAGGIAFLYRAAPEEAPVQQAELVTEAVSAPCAEITPEVTAAERIIVSEAAAAKQEVSGTAAAAAPEEQTEAAPESVPETLLAGGQPSNEETPVREVPEVTEAPTEAPTESAAEWLSYEDEVTLPGFRIEKTGENWLISAEQEHVSFEQLYELQFLPEGAVCIGSDTAEATVTSGFRGHDVYYRTEDADYAFMQYGRIEPSVNFVAAGNEGTAYTSLKPVTVAGHDGYLLVFRQCQELTLTEYQLGWLPGDRFCLIDACTLTEEDLTETVMQMAESAMLTEG